jgi:hypothetical protein
MNSKRWVSPSTFTLISALLVAILGSYAVIVGSQIIPKGVTTTISMIAAIALGSAIVTGLTVGIHRGVVEKTKNPFSDPRSLLAEIALTQTLAASLYNSQTISQIALYMACSILQVWGTWLAFRLATDGLRINANFATKMPWAAAAAVASINLVGWSTRNFWNLQDLLTATLLWQASVHILGLLWVMGWFAVAPGNRLDTKSLRNSVRLRLNSEGKPVSEWTSSVFFAALQLVITMVVARSLKDPSAKVTAEIIMTTPLLFFPALVVAWGKLDQLGTNLGNLTAYSKLTTSGTRRMLVRHSRDDQAWAATVGVRTSTFTIDHDPDRLIGSKVPTTLLQIRNEEILGYINKLIQDQALSLTSIAQKIVGAIDPENSQRPCVDALNLCAAIHLDADSLVERRMGGFISLLPLVNPGLADIIQLETIMPLLKNINGFFHCDFSWVDQSIINTQDSSRYGIYLEPISPKAMQELLHHMRRTHSIGSFIWIGKDAHNRLLHEAPSLVAIMEPHTLKIEGEKDLLVFSAKFELLIPRLQRSFALDATRTRLVNLDIRPEAQRLLSIYAIEIQNSVSEAKMLRIIESIASYSWRGFKEKDVALNLLLKIHLALNSSTSSAISNLESSTAMANALRVAVAAVGYPAQLMNQANLQKAQFRNLETLRGNALNQHSPHFHEAWTILGASDYTHYSGPQIQALREIIEAAIKRPSLLSHSNIQAKIIDCTIGLLRRVDATDLLREAPILVRVVDAMILAKANDETMTMIVDALTFIAVLNKGPLILKESIISFFDRYVSSAEITSPWSNALKGRWQEYRSKYLQDPNKRQEAS